MDSERGYSVTFNACYVKIRHISEVALTKGIIADNISHK